MPYHNCYYDKSPAAIGRAFALDGGVNKIQPSFANIVKELESDIGPVIGFDHSLQHWVDQGVFLLNTSLTVAKGEPGSHSKYWKDFTLEVCKVLSTKDNIIHIMWGKHAQSFKKHITNTSHKFIESPHPSPFSAHNGFFGSKPFSKCNEYLRFNINWLDSPSNLAATSTYFQEYEKKFIRLSTKVWEVGHNPRFIPQEKIEIIPPKTNKDENDNKEKND